MLTLPCSNGLITLLGDIYISSLNFVQVLYRERIGHVKLLFAAEIYPSAFFLRGFEG